MKSIKIKIMIFTAIIITGLVSEAPKVKAGVLIRRTIGGTVASTTIAISPTKYLTTGLVGYWTMDGSKVNWKTGAVTDSSGLGNTGTITNMATSTGVAAGKIGQALNFDGVNDFVNAGSASSLDNLGSMTVSFWINPVSQNTDDTFVAKGTAAVNNLGWKVFSNGANGRLALLVDYSGTGSVNLERRGPNNTFTLNTWNHAVVTWDGSTTAANIHIYLNGTEVSSYTVTTNAVGTRVDDNTQNLAIGAANNALDPFPGLLDEVRIYNRVLSAGEISALYQSGAAKFNVSPTKYLTTGLVGYWTMDGSKVNWKTGTVTDSSGQGHTGTITNMATSTSVAAGKIGQAFNFDGVNDSIVASNALNIIGGIQTVGFWMKATTTQKIIDLNGTASIEVISGTITANNFVNPTIYVDGVVASTVDTGWHHVAVTTGTGINGTAVIIGKIGTGFFNGLLDEVRMYNRALSVGEVWQLYKAGK